jgi:hypothetical protein
LYTGARLPAMVPLTGQITGTEIEHRRQLIEARLD